MNGSFGSIRSLIRFAATGVFIAAVVAFGLVANSFAQVENGDKSPEAIELFQKGQDAHEKGDLAAAIDFFGKAIALVPEFPDRTSPIMA